jgi:SAM-dependent methyltransferase
MTAPRVTYAGVLSILRYNRRYYVASLGAMLAIAALLWSRHLPRAVEPTLIAAAALPAFWTISSLLASWYIYDHSGVTRWNWLPPILSFPPRQWLNIHAGLDESTPILAELFPNTEFTVLDIYDPVEMTEPSIARARQLRQPSLPAVIGKSNALPLPDGARDTVFLLFAAHEIRLPARRTQFFVEAARVLTDSGQLLLVEHLRDWKNFVAFGPGFLHFYSRNQWLGVAHAAGLTVVREDAVTPFVRSFLLTKVAAAPSRT